MSIIPSTYSNIATYRFYLTWHTITYEVFPLNFLSTSLVSEPEKDNIFYRTKFSGKLLFGTNSTILDVSGVEQNRIDDWTLLWIIEAYGPCDRLDFTITKTVGTDVTTYWEGYFTTKDGAFDIDKCTFEVTPLLDDDYTDFELYGDFGYNILSGGLPEVTTYTYETLLTGGYHHNRWLWDVIEYLVAQIDPGAACVSWFFNNANNPVLGIPNQYRYLTIAQKSDIKRPDATNNASSCILSFNELMHILRMYNVYWKYDGTTFRLEHLSYWTQEAGLDLTLQKSATASNKYSYDKPEMPQYEQFDFMEAGDTNYTTHVINYVDSICVKDTVEYSNNVTTDLSYIVECANDPDLTSNIDDDGFVILANYKEGANYYVYYGTAYENAVASYNFVNSWSYLLRAFFLHGRVLMTGYINSTAVDFISAIKTKLQNVNAIVCTTDDFDPNDYITTELGTTYFGGQKGYVKTASLKPSGEIGLSLLYGEDSDETVTMPTRPKTLHCVINAGWDTVYSHLSEPNIYDTYYWLWFDDGLPTETCMEIMIPAGTVYQTDTILAIPLPSTVEFNVSHSSLTGWDFIYNNNDTWDECFDIDCGGVGPPAIPAAPVAISATQSGFCEPVDFSWNTSVGATYYQIYRQPNADGDPPYGLMGTETGTHYLDYDAGLDGGTTYNYKVKACNISGCSGDSNVVSRLVTC